MTALAETISELVAHKTATRIVVHLMFLAGSSSETSIAFKMKCHH